MARVWAQGIGLYLDEVNLQHRVNGKRVVLDIYNDSNNAMQAKQAAERMIEDGKALAVIGHWYSSCSIAAGEIYAREGIVAMSPGSTNNKVTWNNDWYFSTIFNDGSQGNYLANYAVNTLEHKSLTIIHETLTYGSYLGEVFEKTAREHGARVSGVYTIENRNGNDGLQQQVEAITAKVKQMGPDAGLVFIATHTAEAIALVKSFRDAGIQNTLMGPDSLSTAEFWDGFNGHPKEKVRPGYYTQGIYVTAPINFDAANEEAQQFQKRFRKRYGEEATWIPAYAYDTAKVIVAAMRNANVTGDKSNLSSERRAIRYHLKNMNSLDTAVKGVTGYNIFDENGDTDKPVSVARFHNNNIVSSMVHYSIVPYPEEVVDMERELESGRIKKINGRYMYRKNIVYTGIKLNKIGAYDEKNGKVNLEFTIWFRYRGDFKPENIEFLNAFSPINLGRTIHEVTNGPVQYRSYQVNADFRSNFIPSRVPLGEHVIGFTFRHKELSRNSILYITDIIGMGLSRMANIGEKIKKGLLVNGLDGWRIDDVTLFEDTLPVDTLGVPAYLNKHEALVPFSEYHMVY